MISFLIEFEYLYIVHRFARTPSRCNYDRVPIDHLACKVLSLMLHLSVLEDLTLPCVSINMYYSVCDPKTIKASKNKHAIPNHI